MDGGTYAKARVSILAKKVNWEKPIARSQEGGRRTSREHKKIVISSYPVSGMEEDG